MKGTMSMKTKHKKMPRSGGVTIPKEMRAEAGLFPGTAVDLTVTENGILIGRHIPVCRFCGSIEKVVEYRGSEICPACAESIMERVKKNA